MATSFQEFAGLFMAAIILLMMIAVLIVLPRG
jgi:hypothetical protein